LLRHATRSVDDERGLALVQSLSMIAFYAHLKGVRDDQLEACLANIPSCPEASRSMNDLSSSQHETIVALENSLKEAAPAALLAVYSDAQGEFLLSSKHDWGVRGVTQQRTTEMTLPIELLLHASIHPQSMHAGLSKFVGVSPRSATLLMDNPQGFGFQRRRLTPHSAPPSSARADALDLQTSSDSGFVGATIGGNTKTALCVTKLPSHVKGLGIRNESRDIPGLVFKPFLSLMIFLLIFFQHPSLQSLPRGGNSVMTPVTTPGTARQLFASGTAGQLSVSVNIESSDGHEAADFSGKKTPAVRLRVKSDGSSPVTLSYEVLKDNDVLLAYQRCASAFTPILECGLANPTFNLGFSSAPALDFQGPGSKGNDGRGGGKGGGGYEQSVVALAKHEAEVEDRKTKKAAAVLDKQLLRDQTVTELRSKELAVVHAAQEVKPDARFASQEKSHAKAMEALNSVQTAPEAAFKAHLAGLSAGGVPSGMSPWS
jgi:hypothetical protein